MHKIEVHVRFIYNKITLLKFPATKLISKVFNFTWLKKPISSISFNAATILPLEPSDGLKSTSSDTGRLKGFAELQGHFCAF